MAGLAGKVSQVKYLKGAYRSGRRSQPFESARGAQRALVKGLRQDARRKILQVLRRPE